MNETAISFPAMGGSATIVITGDADLLSVARRRVDDLESKWSRFRPHSEISGLNAARTTPCPVSADTRLLVERAVAAWTLTAGAFDPSVHDRLVAWGYDRDLADIRRPSSPDGSLPSPGLGAVRVDGIAGTVDLGGIGFDPGGIGKGLAADVVATELVALGASAALVDLGGDLRVAGEPPPEWTVGIADPHDPEQDLVRMRVSGGGIATSSDRRRRWTTQSGTEAHHLIDPATGTPATTALAGVSVLAGEAWWAEALTKAVLVGGLPVRRLPELGASGIGRTRGGAVVSTTDLRALVGIAA